MNAVPLKRGWRIISLRHLSFHVMEKAPRIPYPAQKAQCSQPLPGEGHQTKYESLLRLLKKNLSRTCKHTYLWFTHYAHLTVTFICFFRILPSMMTSVPAVPVQQTWAAWEQNPKHLGSLSPWCCHQMRYMHGTDDRAAFSDHTFYWWTITRENVFRQILHINPHDFAPSLSQHGSKVLFLSPFKLSRDLLSLSLI